MLNTTDITGCMSSSHNRIHINSTNVSLSFVHKAQSKHNTNEKTTCVIHVVHPQPANKAGSKPLFSVHLSRQTCTEKNFVSFSPDRSLNLLFFKPDYEWDRVVWTGCEPRFDPLPDVLTYQQELWVTIHLADVSENYEMGVTVSSSTRTLEADGLGLYDVRGALVSNRTELEVIYLSRNLGKCQSILKETCVWVLFLFIEEKRNSCTFSAHQFGLASIYPSIYPCVCVCVCVCVSVCVCVCVCV